MIVFETISRPADIEFQPFRPALQERFLARFHQAGQVLADHFDEEERETIIRTEVEWAASSDANQRQCAIYQAIWLLLRDILRVGWSVRWNDITASLEVAPPATSDTPHTQQDIDQQKQQRREVMRHERHTRLRQSRDFIDRMENPKNTQPITAVIADGKALADDLQRIQQLTDKSARMDALRQCVKPYLQLVEDKVRCSHTGLLLRDIWRYFRLTWASPVYTTPGRSLFYLVRDAARPNHPIMGIASLENAPIYIRVRDEHLGWHPEEFTNELVKQWNVSGNLTDVRAEFGHLLNQIALAVGDIDSEGLCTPQELADPTPDLVHRLTALATRFAEERDAALRVWRTYRAQQDGQSKGTTHSNGDSEAEPDIVRQSKYGNISERAQELLFQKKRATELARLISARVAIENLLSRPDFADAWQTWCESERGQSAVRIGLHAVKNRHIGTSILELNICGAVPPYNHLLAGKLTALLMCSPQVADDYRRRYGGMESQIASQLKGSAVIRPAELVYIGTTSLYTAGASQYNRLSLPAGLLRPDMPQIRFERIGKTLGYGSAHISDATTAAMERVTDQDFTEVNHILGEGVSPKLRIIRRGLDALFQIGHRQLTDKIAQHQMSRYVYGILLAENGLDYLQGKADCPHYIWDETRAPAEGTEQIAEFWRARWLDSRLHFAPVLDRLVSFDRSSLQLSQELLEHGDYDWAYTLLKRSPLSAVPDEESDPEDDDVPVLISGTPPDERHRQLVRDLYRGATQYADETSLDDLRRLHAETGLDAAIREHIRAGRSVVLTGNPGDGKTHILRLMEQEIRQLGAEVELDASAVLNNELAERWKAAVATHRPFFIAINESVLFELAYDHPDFAPLQAALDQVKRAVYYSEEPPLATNDVVVFDLSLRNTLAPSVVAAVFDTLLRDDLIQRCHRCPSAGCDLMRNLSILRHNEAANRMRERLQILFNRLARRGVHITMRQLQAFVAYLLFADRDCEHLARESDNADLALAQLAYRGQGRLFDEVRASFDPARVCHPIYDEQLLDNTFGNHEWFTPDVAPAGSLDDQSIEQFKQRKRAFFFYHNKGAELLDFVSDDELAFEEFLRKSKREALRDILRKLTYFFGRRANAETLPVWQSHRYDQSAQRILYAVQERKRTEFELLEPKLVAHMAAAYDLIDDHRLLQLKGSPQASLRVDYTLYRFLHRAEQGLPALMLQPETTRRIWQFLEHLTDRNASIEDEVIAQILDPVTQQEIRVTVDTEDNSYIAINEGQT